MQTKIAPNIEESKKRIHVLDALRGFAIFGILLVNGPTLNGAATKDGESFAFINSLADLWYSNFIFEFAVGNFYPIFACMFGLSAGIFLFSSHKKNVEYFFGRRMLCLFVIGLLHAIFIWWGDILVIYSILGIFLLTIKNDSPKNLLRHFVSLIAICFGLYFFAFFLPEESGWTTMEGWQNIYQNGSFWAVSKQRFFDFVSSYVPAIFHGATAYDLIDYGVYTIMLFAYFVLGLYAFKSGLFKKIVQDYVLRKKLFLASAALLILMYLLRLLPNPIAQVLTLLDGLSHAIFYILLFIMVYSSNLGGKFLKIFEPIGKMSLSNYLAHNLVLSLLFYGYGLGLYGRIGPFTQVLILLPLMVLSMVGSHFWLKNFSFGPVEWLWRKVTYGEIKFKEIFSWRAADKARDSKVYLRKT